MKFQCDLRTNSTKLNQFNEFHIQREGERETVGQSLYDRKVDKFDLTLNECINDELAAYKSVASKFHANESQSIH